MNLLNNVLELLVKENIRNSFLCIQQGDRDKAVDHLRWALEHCKSYIRGYELLENYVSLTMEKVIKDITVFATELGEIIEKIENWKEYQSNDAITFFVVSVYANYLS